MFEPVPCSTQLSVQILFATQRARQCQHCTRNAFVSCSNKSDCLGIEEGAGLPFLGCGWQGGTPLSKLAHLKLALLYILCFGVSL